MSTRNYSNRTLKMLFGRAAGRCSMPECRIDVIVDDSEYDPIVIIGDVAHVAASGDRGPRADQALSPQERDDYENLILLCRNCHARIDGQKQKFPSDVLHRIKNEHEEWVRRSLPERGLSAIGWTTLLLEDSVPVDVTEAISALVPDFPSGDPLRLKIQPATNGWTATRAQLQLAVKEVFNSNDRFASRLAIFPLAAVSSCIALGFEITNRPIVKLFQFHRDAPSWKWDSDNPEATIEPISTTYYPASDEIKDVAFCFHFTAAISENAVDDVIPKNHARSGF